MYPHQSFHLFDCLSCNQITIVSEPSINNTSSEPLCTGHYTDNFNPTNNLECAPKSPFKSVSSVHCNANHILVINSPNRYLRIKPGLDVHIYFNIYTIYILHNHSICFNFGFSTAILQLMWTVFLKLLSLKFQCLLIFPPKHFATMLYKYNL